MIQEMPAVTNIGSLMLSADTTSATGAFVQGTGNLSDGDRVRVRFKLFESGYETDDELEYLIYVVRRDPVVVEGDFEFADQKYLISSIAYESVDVAYSPGPEDARTYSVDLTINYTLGSEEWYVAIFPDVSDSDNTNDYYGAVTTVGVDSSDKLFTCDDGTRVQNYPTVLNWVLR